MKHNEAKYSTGNDYNSKLHEVGSVADLGLVHRVKIFQQVFSLLKNRPWKNLSSTLWIALLNDPSSFLKK